MTKQEIIEMIERAGFEAVERDTVYNRVTRCKFVAHFYARVKVGVLDYPRFAANSHVALARG